MSTDPEELVVCPYDPVHKVAAKKMQYHINKCRKQYDKNREYKTCPFNARHVIPAPEFEYHKETCDSKGPIEMEIAFEQSRHEATNVAKGYTDIPPPPVWEKPKETENWDDEDEDAPPVLRPLPMKSQTPTNLPRPTASRPVPRDTDSIGSYTERSPNKYSVSPQSQTGMRNSGLRGSRGRHAQSFDRRGEHLLSSVRPRATPSPPDTESLISQDEFPALQPLSQPNRDENLVRSAASSRAREPHPSPKLEPVQSPAVEAKIETPVSQFAVEEQLAPFQSSMNQISYAPQPQIPYEQQIISLSQSTQSTIPSSFQPIDPGLASYEHTQQSFSPPVQVELPQIYSQQLTQPYAPSNQPFNTFNQPYSPSGQTFTPSAQPFNPSSQPFNPSAQPFNPSAQPFIPQQNQYVTMVPQPYQTYPPTNLPLQQYVYNSQLPANNQLSYMPPVNQTYPPMQMSNPPASNYYLQQSTHLSQPVYPNTQPPAAYPIQPNSQYYPTAQPAIQPPPQYAPSLVGSQASIQRPPGPGPISQLSNSAEQPGSNTYIPANSHPANSNALMANAALQRNQVYPSGVLSVPQNEQPSVVSSGSYSPGRGRGRGLSTKLSPKHVDVQPAPIAYQPNSIQSLAPQMDQLRLSQNPMPLYNQQPQLQPQTNTIQNPNVPQQHYVQPIQTLQQAYYQPQVLQPSTLLPPTMPHQMAGDYRSSFAPNLQQPSIAPPHQEHTQLAPPYNHQSHISNSHSSVHQSPIPQLNPIPANASSNPMPPSLQLPKPGGAATMPSNLNRIKAALANIGLIEHKRATGIPLSREEEELLVTKSSLLEQLK